MFVYREFGGNLWIRDGRGQTAVEMADHSSAPALKYLKQFQGVFGVFFYDIPFNPILPKSHYLNANYKRLNLAYSMTLLRNLSPSIDHTYLPTYILLL